MDQPKIERILRLLMLLSSNVELKSRSPADSLSPRREAVYFSIKILFYCCVLLNLINRYLGKFSNLL